MGVPLGAAVQGGGGLGAHLQLTRCPTKRRQPSEVDELQVPLMAQTAPGPYPVLQGQGILLTLEIQDLGPGHWLRWEVPFLPRLAWEGPACIRPFYT